MTIFRPAQEADLTQMYEVFYQNEILDIQNPPPQGDMSDLVHTFQTGTVYVAERENTILAFAGAITRGEVTFLTDLFVRPDQQSTQLGKLLLPYVLPQSGLIHSTMSSTDPRALALYIRSGMHPAWPHFFLQLEKSAHSDFSTPGVEVVMADAADPALVQCDAQLSGRSRPQDHVHWITKQQAVPMWFHRRGQTVGYGYVRLGAGTLWYPESCTIGPIGVNALEDVTECVLAAVNWALKHANVLQISVPGPHPSLAELLTKGFRIVYVETFLSTSDVPFFEARRYITSGSNLL